jgi:hypothetical protein
VWGGAPAEIGGGAWSRSEVGEKLAGGRWGIFGGRDGD